MSVSLSSVNRIGGHGLAVLFASSLGVPLAAAPYGVSVDAEEAAGDTKGACKPSFSFTYPTDIEPHERRVRIQGDNGLVDIDEVWHFPLDNQAYSPREAGDDMISATFASFDIAPCRQTMWVVTIGPCYSASCPPMGLLRSAKLRDMTVIKRRVDH